MISHPAALGERVYSLNIYDFFNSPDVAEYCRSIGHTFNAVEAAVMVDNSNTRTFAEKLAAFRAIIAEYPDMELPKGNNHDYHKSFHKALGDLIIYEERKYARFMEVESNTVFQARFKEKYDDGTDDFTFERNIFSSYEKALADALEYINSEHPASKQGILSGVWIRKIFIDSVNYVEAKVSQKGEILKIDHNNKAAVSLENGIDSWLLSIYIDVPVPFKRGDLVEIDDGSWMGDVYVLIDICRDKTKQNAKWLYQQDLMDMTANVHYESKGSLYCGCMHFYPDLRYCRRKLKGAMKILRYVSLHMQDKLCLCNLLKIQKILENIPGDILLRHLNIAIMYGYFRAALRQLNLAYCLSTRRFRFLVQHKNIAYISCYI